jgi:hypothetical protein
MLLNIIIRQGLSNDSLVTCIDMKLFWMLLAAAVIAILDIVMWPFNISTVVAHHEKQKCTPLYSLTFPPQKRCVILSHPTGKALVKANRENIKYNAKCT